ncbi:MAG TPA: hypothetical protein VF820_00550 [Patescibacteria group bacterium]
MQRWISFLFLPTLLSLIVLFLAPEKTAAEAYPCQTYSGQNECIDLKVTSGCNGNSPTVTWSWTKKFGNTSFNIVYSRNGNWYQYHVGNVTSWTMVNPPFGNDGSAGQDNAPIKFGEYISGKITGGVPRSEGGSGITTGYTNPDVATTVQSCIPPTATPIPPSATITPSPTPAGPLQTTANVIFHVEGIDVNNIPNVIPSPGKHGQSGWPFTLYVYGATQNFSANPLKTFTDIATEAPYDPNDLISGTFQNQNFAMTGLGSGTYKFLVSTPMGSLRTQIGNGTFAIKGGQNNILVTVDPNNTTLQGIPYIAMGDITGDNQIDVLDYSIMTDCYGNSSTSSACLSDAKALKTKFTSLPSSYLPGDLNDNGKVDGIDFNTMLRGPFGQIGAGGPQTQ